MYIATAGRFLYPSTAQTGNSNLNAEQGHFFVRNDTNAYISFNTRKATIYFRNVHFIVAYVCSMAGQPPRGQHKYINSADMVGLSMAPFTGVIEMTNSIQADLVRPRKIHTENRRIYLKSYFTKISQPKQKYIIPYTVCIDLFCIQ